FFQAEDGIRDGHVTGVQTCALPIYLTAVGKSGRGTSASQGNFRAERDPFVAKALQRAFVTCLQSQQLQVTKFRSDPLALAPGNRSEERRVGKECRCGGSACDYREVR